MNKETYERMSLVITEFDTEDVIATSGMGGNEPGGDDPGTGGGGGQQHLTPAFTPDNYEMPIGF